MRQVPSASAQTACSRSGRYHLMSRVVAPSQCSSHRSGWACQWSSLRQHQVSGFSRDIHRCAGKGPFLLAKLGFTLADQTRGAAI